jgi:hypothetical protein
MTLAVTQTPIFLQLVFLNLIRMNIMLLLMRVTVCVCAFCVANLTSSASCLF